MLTGVRTHYMRFATCEECQFEKGIWEGFLERMKLVYCTIIDSND